MYPRGMLGTTLPRGGHSVGSDSTHTPPLNITEEALQIAQRLAPEIAEEDGGWRVHQQTMHKSYHRSSVPDYIPDYVPSHMADNESQKSSLSGATPLGSYLMKTAFGNKFSEACSPSSTRNNGKGPSYYGR